MEYKRFSGSKKEVSVIGIGTWMLENTSESIEAIRYAIQNKVTFIDTAEIYGTEPIVREAIKGMDREKLFIATKVWPTHFSHSGVIKACKASLSNLGIDYIDLYQLHWPNRKVSIKETMAAMEELVGEGLVRHIGVSNFSLDEMKEAQDALSKYELASNQVEYNVVTREIEPDLYNYCMENSIAIIAYSPLAHGYIFKGKLFEELSKIGSKYGKTAGQIALNWVASRNAFPIPKASSIKHAKEDIEALDFKLDEEDMDAVSALYAKYPKKSLAAERRESKGFNNSYDFSSESAEQV